MDEEGGKEQSETSENGCSLVPVNTEVNDTPASSGSHCASAEGTGDTCCRTETSQEVAETGGVSSSDDVLVKRTGKDEPMEPCEASCQQSETKDMIDPQEGVIVTTVTVCSEDANNVSNMNEGITSPAGEQKDTHGECTSGEKPSGICENDQGEAEVTSQSTINDRSSTPEKGNDRVLNDQALDSQPSTPTGKCRSEIFDESMLTESSAFSEDGKLVIGTPRSVESPAVPGAEYEVDRTRHPADIGCEVEIAGDFLPLDCTPSTSYCTPNTSYCETPETGTDLSMNQTPNTGLRLVKSKKRKRKRVVLGRKKQRKVMPVRRVDEEENNLEVVIDQALDLDGDLERKLEENAAKNNLTAINVKSILHHVITNEHVLSMVRNTMTDAGLVEIEREPAAYTPKLTRAKLKEATEKVGNMPYVWPLSPVKNKKATPGFIEINFSDDTSSDDEDYKPTMDELMREESDYESVTSQMSDFGSPCCSTPPRSVQPSITESEIEDSPSSIKPAASASTPKSSQRPVARHLQVVPVPMGPPPAPLNPDRLGDDDAFLRELAAVTKEEANIIAHRTRSKLTINKPLEAIEASFIAPDAEHDMYDVYESDHEDVEWKNWLASLYRTEDTTNTEPTDDEQNDPEYNFLAEEEPEDREDFRTDRAVRVSKKELNELLDEVVEAYGDEVDWLDDFDMAKFDQDSQSSLLGSLIQQKQKFSPSKFYTMPSSSYAGAQSTSSLAPGASTSAKFSLGEALSSIMAAAAAAAEATLMETTATTLDEATAASATGTTAVSAIEATVLATSKAVVTEATMPSSSEPTNSGAAEQPHPQLPLPQQPLVASAATISPVIEQQVSAASIQQAPPVAWTIEAKTLPSLTVNGDELEQLQQQLQQHVQLLCQMHLIAREDDSLTDCANQSNQFLAELDLLAGVNEEGIHSQGGVSQRPITFQSFFRPCNLGGALELVKTPKLPCKQDPEEETPKPNKKRKPGSVSRSKPPPLLNDLRNMIAKSNVFLHAELLPKNMFYDISRSAKIIFVEGEDKLVARGLHQFSSYDNTFHLIQSLMMPCKTASQIRNRIKNLTSHRKCKMDVTNPIVVYKHTKQLSYSPSMCAMVKSHQATAPVNTQNKTNLPKWLLNIKGVQAHIKEQAKGKKHLPTLSPLKPKVHIPLQAPAQDQKVVQIQDQAPAAISSSVPVITQFPPEAPRYILASNVGLTAGGLILQSGQQFLQQGLLPRTVCEVKYVIDSPQMSAFASGSAAAEALPSMQRSFNTMVSSPATQGAATSSTNPVVGLQSNNLLSLASIYANPSQSMTLTPATVVSQVEPQQTVRPDDTHKETAAMDVVVSSSASKMELPDTQANAKTAPHSVVRTLQFSKEPASILQTASEPMYTESYQTNANERVAVPLPQTQTENALHTTQVHDPRGTAADNSVPHVNQESWNHSAERTELSETTQSVFSNQRKTQTRSVHPGVMPKNTVRQLIEKRRNKKMQSPRRKFGGFVSMSSLAAKGVSSLNRFKIGTSRRSPERIRFRSPSAKRSPGRMTVRMDNDMECSPHSAKASPESAESSETNRPVEYPVGGIRTSDSSDDCIPLEAALRQLDEEEGEETVRTSSPIVADVENLVSLACEESPSDITASPVKVAKEVYIPSPTALSASPHSGPSLNLKHSPLQMTVRMDDKVAMEATVPAAIGRGTSPESMQGLTIGSSVGSASQILAANRVQSPSIELPRTASTAIPEGDTPLMVSSLPAVQQEDTTSQMSEGAASANSNPKLPFDSPTDHSEMMASTATGGKSPTLDEQSAAREFLSGGEQGGPGEDGEEETEMGRRSNVKVAAKRIKSKLRKDLESTVVLLDPDIVNQDPHKEEREFAFAKDFLDRVKEALHDSLDQYRQFLRVFNEHSEDPDSSIADLYYSVKDVLSDRPELIEEFTAFIPPEVALQCGVFLECLEFSKARLFLRQVEVHFYKQPAHIQRIVHTMIQWGETQRNYQDLKEALIPLLKGQPHLEQELSMLFPDSRPPENYMMDFEEINLTDEKKMPCDDFEEIELSESEEEDEGTVTKQQGRGATDRNILDPWKGLNDELQYGTRSCKCNCHETSQDTRVKRKTRHCAYCSAMVTRAELISSLRGLGPVRRRPIRDGPVIRRRTGVGKRRGRGSKLADAAKGEDGVGGSYPTNEAVNHLSQMCDNLADYLQDNPSATEDEDEVEDDDEEEGGDEDHDDEDDDEEDHDDDDDEDVGDEDDDEEDEMGVATGDDEDDDDEDDMVDNEDDIEGHEDEEDDDDVAEDQDDEDDDDVDIAASEDDADDEAEDGGELNHMTSGESTDDLTGDHSPCTSQGSRETMASGNSNSGSNLSTSPTSSHTTLLGSGVTMDTDSRSLTCSPTEFQDAIKVHDAIKDKEKSNDASIDSENKENNATSDVKDTPSVEPENGAKEVPVASLESAPTNDKKGQGKDGDASASSERQESEMREPAESREEIERREEETHPPAGDEESMGDGGVREEPRDGDEEEQGVGGAADPQQSSAKETDGASSASVWNRDADRVLLQACQEKGASEETFANVASQLNDKTSQQVKERFAILMKLFHLKASPNEEPSNDEDDEEESEDDDEEEEEDEGDETES